MVHASAVPQEELWPAGSARFGVRSRELALAVGSRDLGYCITTVEPGRRSCPYHFHHSEEEVFYVLEGRGQLRQGDREGPEELIELAPGDVIAFPPGTGIAHQFINPGPGPFVYLALSNRIRADVAEYPDSDKLLIRGTRLMLRRGPKLQYLDGEDG